MNIDISKLKLNKKRIDINGTYDIDLSLYNETEIKKINNLEVNGYITDEYNIYLEVQGEMILPDSRTLENISYNFSFEIDENKNEITQFLKNYENILDLQSLLWENIVLEIPIRIVKDENEKIELSGDGWELTDHKRKNDDRMAPLKELFKDGKEN